ncbi:MAG: phage tail tape measure protein [Chloroflexota bacterium]
MAGDDVVIRVGSARGSRAGFTALARDVETAGDDINDLRQDLTQLARTEADPQVQVRAQAALADLDRVEDALRRFDGMDAEAAAQVNADTGAIDRALADLHRIDGETAEMHVEVDAESAEGSVNGLKGKLAGAAKSVGSGIGLAIGSALTDSLAGAVSDALEKETANAGLQAKFVGDPEEMAKSGRIAGQLWSQAYGENMDEVNSAVFAVMTSSAQMRGASEGDITKITGLAMDLSKTWGVDVSESIRAAGQMVNNGLVPDTVSGLGLMHEAWNTLGPAGDDAIDTVVEYSTQFRQLGLDGPQALQAMSQALGAGARDSDTAADALKEFTLLAQSMPESAAEGYTRLGLSSSKMQADISAGGDRATTALDTVLDRLRGMKNQTNQAEIATALFGTKAEDLQDALFAIDIAPATKSFDTYGQKLEEVSAIQSDTTQNHIEQTSRASTAVIQAMAGQGDATEAAATGAVGVLGLWNDMFGETAASAEATSVAVTDSSNRAADGMTTGFGRGVTSAMDYIGGLPGRISGSLSGLYGQGHGAGADLSEGMRQGIISKLVAIADAARRMAMAAVNSVRNAIGAHSPATATIDAGQDFDDGFGVGIDRHADGPISSAGDLGRAAAAQLRGAGRGGGAAPAMAGAGSGMPVGGAEVVFSGGLDSAFATAFMGMVRAGKIQIRATT